MSDTVWNGPKSPVEDQRIHVPWTQWLAAFSLSLLILFSSHSFQFLFVEVVETGLTTEPTARSSPYYQGLFLVQFSMFALLLFFHVLRNGITIPLLILGAIIAYMGAAVLWSLNPRYSMFPTVLFCYTVMAAYTASTFFPPRQFLRLFFYVCTFILVSSFVLLMVDPDSAGTTRFTDGWFSNVEFNGVMASKNFAGAVFAAAAILAVNGNRIGISLVMRVAVFFMATVAIVMSNSATAVVILVLIGGLSLLLRGDGPGRIVLLYWVLLGTVALIATIPFLTADELVQLLGRDSTFTGRVALWSHAFSVVPDHPLLGHGYKAFFETGRYSPVWELWEKAEYFFPRNFHNSAVEIVVALGATGLIVLLAVTVKASSIVRNQSLSVDTRITLGLLLSVFLIISMMEFAVFHHNYIANLVLFYCLFASMWRYNEQ